MATPDASRMYFEALTPDQKVAAILRLADAGYSDTLIATASGLALEQVRTIVGERAMQSVGMETTNGQ